MRKIVILMILAIFLVGCASGPIAPTGYTMPDPNMNPFIGEWMAQRWSDCRTFRVIENYTFTESQFTFTDTLGRNDFGSYSFDNRRITFTAQDRQWRWGWEIYNPIRLGLTNIPCHICPNGRRGVNLIREPYSDLVYDIWQENYERSEIFERVDTFSSNQEELANIQGVWRMNGNWQVTYTFSGNNFTLTSVSGNAPRHVSGTFNINDNLVIFTVDNEYVGLAYYEINNNILHFTGILGTRGYIWWGNYIRQ